MAKKRTIRTIPQQRTAMREQDARDRATNFSEVACGYAVEEALRESERCLLCPEQPCISGCPVNINIPGFIEKLGAKDFRGAYDIITATNLLPAVCGRVCPQENQCEGVCTVGESLEPAIEAFLAGRRDEAVDLLPRDVVRRLVQWGSWDEIRTGLAEHAAAGVTTAALYFLTSAADPIEKARLQREALKQLAPRILPA